MMEAEIPVVVDIYGAFKEVAKKVGPALKDVQEVVNKNQIDLFPHIEESIKKLNAAKDTVERIMRELRGTMTRKEAMLFAPSGEEIGHLKSIVEALSRAQLTLNQASGFDSYVMGLSRANFELAQMNEYYKRLEEYSFKQSDSINRYSQRLRELNEQWNSMTSKERSGPQGVKVYEEARRVTTALREQALTLDQMIAKEDEHARAAKRAAEERAAAAEKEAQRIDAARKKGIKTRQYENAILNSTTKTMRVLQEQERILSERLSRATVGSEKYEKLKAQLQKHTFKIYVR